VAIAAAGGGAGCGGAAQSGCQLWGNVIVCFGETFDDCAAASCSSADLDCSKPPTGCQIAPGTVLAHYAEKPPNDNLLCGEPQTTCGTWSVTGCQVTVTTYAGGTDAGGTIAYTVHDSTCP
jgi:hypothetical protein